MDQLKLIIGSKNISSWSLRPWLLLKQIGVPFEEEVIPLQRPDTPERIRRWSPSGFVPVLVFDGLKIWDSLAIAEFLAEHDPSLWPADPRERAQARSIAAEMHSGFRALRTFMPMDFTARFNAPGRLLLEVQADIRRVVEIWADCRRRYGQRGPFLFGQFGIVDAMFAPVCSRFTTYGIRLDPVCNAYVQMMMNLPAMRIWARDAAEEVAREPPPPMLPAEISEADFPDDWAETEAVAEPQPWPPPAPPPEPSRVAEPRAESGVEASRPVEIEPTPPVRAPSPSTALPPSPPPVMPPAAPPMPVEPVRAAPPKPRPAAIDAARLEAPRVAPPRAAEPARPEPPRREPPKPEPAEAEPARPLPRPIPSTIMVKPIGDYTRRRR